MDGDMVRTAGSMRLKRDLGREAVNLALKGEWERATEVNKAILELFTDDVEAMNRLGKALIELADYDEARAVLDRVCEVAPYNNIAKKNRARLEQLSSSPAAGKQTRKAAGVPQLYIEETGKTGTTALRNTAKSQAVAHISPNDAVTLVEEKNAISVHTSDGEYLGQLEPKLGKRLASLIQGGNQYVAAVISVNGQEVSVIIRETFRHRSLQNVVSFRTKTKDETKVHLSETAARFIREEEQDDDDDDENVIDEDAMDNDWAENE